MARETVSEEPLLIKTNKQTTSTKTSLFTAKSIFFCGVATLTYLALSYFLIGFKADQFILVGIFNFCFFASRITRQFIIGFSIFIIYWIIFDYMKAFPNYLFNEVHIEELYKAEKALFGINWKNTLLTPNEYFSRNHTLWIDILAGIFYLSWVPIPLAFAGYLFFKKRECFFRFSLTFFLVNLIGFVGYYLYPAAPPWYVAQYGFDFNPATPGNTAGLGRFDSYFNVSVFEGMYAKSSNVFAAMPSMHAAFMMIVVFFAFKLKMGAWNLLFISVMMGIWFSAVYSGHHYILDVLAGIFSAALGIALLQWWIKTAAGQKLLRLLLFHTSN